MLRRRQLEVVEQRLSAGCRLTRAIQGKNPSQEIPKIPTLPLLSGTFFTSQSVVT
jgi:hypothetical protein